MDFEPTAGARAMVAVLPDRLPGLEVAAELPAPWWSAGRGAETSALFRSVGLRAAAGYPTPRPERLALLRIHHQDVDSFELAESNPGLHLIVDGTAADSGPALTRLRARLEAR
jgi:hypothetical protein